MNHSISSDDEEDYEEIAEEINVKCLFCEEDFADKHFSILHQVFEHINKQHGIDFGNKCRSLNLDAFQYIKLINYIRKNNIKPSNIEHLLSSQLFDDDIYLKPTLEDDSLLMFGML